MAAARRCALTVLALEAVSYAAIWLSRPLLVDPVRRTRTLYANQSAAIRRFLAGDRGIWAFDSVLGWRWPSHYRDAQVETNSFGLLSRREYDSVPPPGVVRVSAFGNSFVVGADVPLQDAWLAQLGQAFPRIETINYGVAAYGTDQSLLQYLVEGRRLRPTVVLIGLAADNLRRNPSVYRRFLTPQGAPLTKPRFLIDTTDRLTLVPNPLRRPEDLQRYLDDPAAATELGRHDQWYEPAVYENPVYDWSATVRLATAVWIRLRRRFFDRDALYRGATLNPASSGFRLELALLRSFVDSVRGDGAVPLVMVLPSVFSYRRSLRGEPAELAPLVDTLRARGIDVVDVTDALLADPARADPARLYMPGLHFTPYAGGVIARWLGPQILRRVPAAGAPASAPP